MGLDEPYWAALSVMIIANVDRDALFTKGVLRIAGTFIGVSSGYVVGQFMEGLPFQQAALVMIAAGVGTYGRQRSAYGYAWFYGALTFALVMLYTMVQPQDLYSFAHYRCYEIVIGVTCGTLANGHWGRARASFPPSRAAGGCDDGGERAVAGHRRGGGRADIILTWSQFDLPQLPQVLISSLIVVDSDPIATRHRGAQRIFGCIIGGTAALLVIALDATLQWWWTAMLFLGVFSFARIHLTKIGAGLYRHAVGHRLSGDDGQRRPADFHGTPVERPGGHHYRGEHHDGAGLGL